VDRPAPPDLLGAAATAQDAGPACAVSERSPARPGRGAPRARPPSRNAVKPPDGKQRPEENRMRSLNALENALTTAAVSAAATPTDRGTAMHAEHDALSTNTSTSTSTSTNPPTDTIPGNGNPSTPSTPGMLSTSITLTPAQTGARAHAVLNEV